MFPLITVFISSLLLAHKLDGLFWTFISADAAAFTVGVIDFWSVFRLLHRGIRAELVAEKAFLGVGWAFPPRNDPRGDVETAAYEEDIRQSIQIILGTRRGGERVMRPDFGAGLYALVFEPINTTTMELIKHHVEEALILSPTLGLS